MEITQEQHDKAYGDYSKVHDPKNIPAEISRTLFISFGVGKYVAGNIKIDTVPPNTGDEDFTAVLICTHEVNIKLPVCQIDVKARLLEIFSTQREQIVAENHMRLKAIDDKIASLLAIDYQPATQDSEMPF